MEISKKGLVFSIQRFAIHDGQGIRTTIFLKGCNLRCVWCHNPEGLEIQSRILVRQNKCIYCHRCCAIDKDQVMQDIGTNMRIKNKEDVDYQKYIDICPTGAIQYDARTYSVDQLLTEVLKDQVFFKYGGGVSISGGEPLLQVDFVIAFLKKCKEHKIHTTIETALHVPLETIKKVMPYLDTLYCDIKEIDNTKHEAFTAVKNNQILDNVRYLATSKYQDKLIIRTPMIPNHSATIANIMGIAKFIVDSNPNISYELLNYNSLAISKYQELQQPFCLDASVLKYSKQQMEEFKQVARESGVVNVL